MLTLLISADCLSSTGNEDPLWIIPVAVIVGLLILGAIILAIVLLIFCIMVNGPTMYKNRTCICAARQGMMACSNNILCVTPLYVFINMDYALLLLYMYAIIPILLHIYRSLCHFYILISLTMSIIIGIATYISFVCHQYCLWIP